jgi:hypothetical protein
LAAGSKDLQQQQQQQQQQQHLHITVELTVASYNSRAS